MQTKQRRILGAAGVVVVAAGAGGALFVAASRTAERQTDLLSRAVPLVAPDIWRGTAPGAAPPSGGKYTSAFYWLNDHEVLRFTKSGTGKTASSALSVLDLSSGKPRPVPGAPRLTINQNPLSVSPNGAWLLCVNRNVTPSRLFAIALDGSGRRHSWKDTYPGGGIWWFRDSKRFATVNYDWTRKFSVARVYRMDDEKPGKMSRLANLAPLRGVKFPDRGGMFPIGQLPGGRFLGASARAGTGSEPATATLTEFGLDATAAAPPRAVTVPAPPTKTAPTGGIRAALGTSAHLFSSRRAQLSPQGDRLLWVVNTFEFSSVYGSRSGALGRVLPYVYRALPRRMRPRPSLLDSYDLYTARVDGRGGVTHIGSVAPTETGSGSIGSDFLWMPDGKRITFTRRNAIYAVPADGP